MKYLKVTLLISLICSLIPAINCNVTSVESEQEFRKHLNSTEPTIIYCTANWCTACTEQMKPVINTACAKYSGKVKFVEVDYDKHKNTCQELGITGLPRMIFVKPGKDRVILGGSRPQNVFDYNVDEFLKGTLKPDEIVSAPAETKRNNVRKKRN